MNIDDPWIKLWSEVNVTHSKMCKAEINGIFDIRMNGAYYQLKTLL